MDNHSADMVEFGPRTHVLVTGGAGFVGSAVVDLLLARNCSVTVIDDLSNGSLHNLPASDPRLTIHTFRIGDPAFHTAVHHEVGQADAVFHLASPIGVQLAHKERFAVTSGILSRAARLSRHADCTGARFFIRQARKFTAPAGTGQSQRPTQW